MPTVSRQVPRAPGQCQGSGAGVGTGGQATAVGAAPVQGGLAQSLRVPLVAGDAPQLLGVLLAAVPHGRLQRLLLAVEVGELVEDDGDGQCHDQDAPQDAARGRQLPCHGDRHHVPVAHGGHADRAPPPARWDGVEADVFLLLGSVGHSREDRDPHSQVEQQDPHLPVAVLEGKAEPWSVGITDRDEEIPQCKRSPAQTPAHLHQGSHPSIHLCCGMSCSRGGLGWECMGDSRLEQAGQPGIVPGTHSCLSALHQPVSAEREDRSVLPSQESPAEAAPLPPALTLA